MSMIFHQETQNNKIYKNLSTDKKNIEASRNQKTLKPWLPDATKES